MRKYYYVCPRCGRCYKRYIPRRKTKCGFCSTVWKTRGAKGTRSAFSWTATLGTILAIAVAVFFVGREFGVFSNPSDWGKKTRSLKTELPASVAPESADAASVENATSDAEIGGTAENTESLGIDAATETLEATETTETSEDAAAE